jgi:hypothetical protein
MRNLFFRIFSFFLPHMAYESVIERLVALFNKADEKNAVLTTQVAMLYEQLVEASGRDAASAVTIAQLTAQAEQARLNAEQAQKAFDEYQATDLVEDQALEAFITSREQLGLEMNVSEPTTEEPVISEETIEPAPVEPAVDAEGADVVIEPAVVLDEITEEAVEG